MKCQQSIADGSLLLITFSSMTIEHRLPCSLCFTASPAFICIVGSQIACRYSNLILCISAYPFVLFARAQSFFEVFYPVCQSYDFSRHLFLPEHYSFTVHLCSAVWAILETVCAATKTAHRTGAQHRIRNTVASPPPMRHRGNIGGRKCSNNPSAF